MKTTSASLSGRLSGYLFSLTLFMLALSGFAQMPIFKRYYIADVPGLGWLAAFYTTHYLHYLFAVVFLAYCGYGAAAYLLEKRGFHGLSAAGWIRLGILGGLTVTGVLLVVRNLSGIHMPPAAIITLDLGHLMLVMALLMTGLVGLVFKKRLSRA